ncbi:hypothetical protein HZS_4959 [Henneguya salminicola]|nr:hypothetical protein HZS_4959 [Henneguya salminicola]
MKYEWEILDVRDSKANEQDRTDTLPLTMQINVVVVRFSWIGNCRMVSKDEISTYYLCRGSSEHRALALC